MALSSWPLQFCTNFTYAEDKENNSSIQFEYGPENLIKTITFTSKEEAEHFITNTKTLSDKQKNKMKEPNKEEQKSYFDKLKHLLFECCGPQESTRNSEAHILSTFSMQLAQF